MSELITAAEARQEVEKATEDRLNKADTRDISRAIRKRAEDGLRDAVLQAPMAGSSKKNQERAAEWVRAARAALTGAGYEVQANRGAQGAYLVVRW